MHILSTWSSCPRPTKLETLGVGPSNLCFNKLPGNSDAYLGTTTIEDVALILNYNEWMPPPSLNEHFVLSGESTNIFSSYLDSLSIVSCTQKMYRSQNRQIIFWLRVYSSRQWQTLPKPQSDSPWNWPGDQHHHHHHHTERSQSLTDSCVKRGLDSLDPVTFRF